MVNLVRPDLVNLNRPQLVNLTGACTFIENGLNTQLFEQFFFVRYRDEAGHLRIRFYNSDTAKQGRLQDAFMSVLQPLLDDGTIDKITLDTYNRELERYDESLIKQTETLFHNDSLAVLRFLDRLNGTDSEKYRMIFALRGIDMLLDDFKFTLQNKQILLKLVQGNFFREFGASPNLQKQLNEKYRKYQSDFFMHMNADNDIQNEIEEAVAVFEIRSDMNKDVIEHIKSILNENALQVRLTQLLPSYIHMFINRLFIAQQRKYEMVAYHFLEKYYTSQLAICKKRAQS